MRVDEGDVVLDVGANVGVAAAYFAFERRAGLVHAFEPVPAAFEMLSENLRQFPACVAHPVGLSSAPGEVDMTFYPAAAAMSSAYADPPQDTALVRTAMVNLGLSSGEAGRRVPEDYAGERCSARMTTLSAFLRDQELDRVDLLKIDVERAELDVLGGIEPEDWPRIAQVAMEVHGEERSAASRRLLAERGFEVTGEQDDALRGTEVSMLYAVRA